MVIMAAADEVELMHMVATAAGIGDRPSALRYPRGAGLGERIVGERPQRGTPLPLGRGRVLRQGTDLAILTLGPRLYDALTAADLLAEQGISVTIADARFAKPLDTALIERLAREHAALVLVEEGSVGGFGAAVMQHLAWRGLLDGGLRVRPMVLPDRFLDHNSPAKQLVAAGLTANDIVTTARAALGR